MRLVFAGTPAFAAASLEAVLDAGHEVVGVLTQPDRPAGRGMKLQASPVKQLALQRGLPVAQPQGLKLDGRYAADAVDAKAQLEAWVPELMVVAAYGLILPRWVLTLPPLGCLNIHASLLPRWRGAAPIHRAIEAGDAETGITLMQMDEGLDTGAMLLRAVEPIRADDSTASLHDRLAALGARLCVQGLAEWTSLRAEVQPETGISYAHKIEKQEGAVDWTQPAELIERRLRAFDPFPGMQAQLGAETLKLWRGRLSQGRGQPGSVLAWQTDGPEIACGTGSLVLTEVQRPGGRRGPAVALLQQAMLNPNPVPPQAAHPPGTGP
ncbi:methionyl-tRNA formyltransferase [Inhella sp.]|uniref:methionyl-tRNA formyltransferase n=1 Tax=Inhella sp. TaxID=1921806 RepID=UPI0035B3315B